MLDPYDNKIPVRFIFDPSFLLTVSTDKDDKKMIKQVMEEIGCDRYEAIDMIMARKGITYQLPPSERGGL